MAIILGENRYGKAEIRVFRVTRSGDTHEVLDLNVTVLLSGDFSATHLTGDNTQVLTTDAMKNTVFVFSHEYGAMEPEAFGLLLARHFVAAQSHVLKAEVRIEKFDWDRIISKGKPHPSAFRRNGSMTRTATALVCRDGAKTKDFIVCGLNDLVILKTSKSEFGGFLRDKYTTLAQTTDRIMATEVCARWRISASESLRFDRTDWAKNFRDTVDTMLGAFAEHHSLSLQQTLFLMGERVLSNQPEIAAIRLSLPNKHHFAVDLSAFDRENHNEVFIAADRPYGLIEAVIERDDANTASASSAPASAHTWPAW
jgi:urate oxidase